MSLEQFFNWANEQGYNTLDQLAEKMDVSRRTVYRHLKGEIKDTSQFRDRAVFVFGDVVRQFFNDTPNVASDNQESGA